tara:strand:- start:387 stop:1082 length:696 start_codon:yes stop_codon:yes gene_type:complete
MIYSIEGNVGSGKSTLVAELQKQLEKQDLGVKVLFAPEPVESWLQVVDPVSQKNIIELFYADQDTYSFSFQMLAYITRLNLITDMVRENPDAIIISERSVYTDRAVFARMLFDSGKMKPVEYQIYTMWFNYFEKNLGPHTFIHLNTPPGICEERVKKRARQGENIPLDYLHQCDKYHYDWMEQQFDARGGHKYVLEYILDQEQMVDAIRDIIKPTKITPNKHSHTHYVNQL